MRWTNRVLGCTFNSIGLLLCALLTALPSAAQSGWKGGTIVDLTSGEGKIMIRLDTGMPDNC
jgi:hypothetical protein